MKRTTEEKIKLIWDFHGPVAAKTAEHHTKHLAEFIVLENLNNDITGFINFSDYHSAAYMVVDKSELKEVRAILKPHRGQIFKNENS
jgi:hypothetical protein